MVWLVAVALGGCATGSGPGPESAPHVETPPPVATSDEAAGGSEAPPPAPAMSSEPAPTPVDPLLSGQIVWETKDSGVAVPAEWRACSGPEDCQLVVTTCCDECNGGKAVSVAKAHVAEMQAKHGRTGCGACTKRGCSTRAACEAGRCVMQWQTAR